MYGWRGRIGMVVPCANTTMEPEFHRLAAELPGLGIHTTRMHIELTVKGDITTECLFDMERLATSTVVSELAHAKVGVIAYGCTSGSFVGGSGWDRQIIEEIRGKTGIATTTATTAVVVALRELAAQKVALGTPYSDEITGLGKAFLESEGFEVVSAIGLDNVPQLAEAPAGMAYQLARKVDTPSADCVFLSCTHFPTIHAIDMLERDLGKPVISANQASFWHAVQILGVRAHMSGFGRLLEEVSIQGERIVPIGV